MCSQQLGISNELEVAAWLLTVSRKVRTSFLESEAAWHCLLESKHQGVHQPVLGGCMYIECNSWSIQ
jgi:hypothetical protein